MSINVDYLNRCIAALEGAHKAILKQNPEDVVYDIYRAACVKEFEIILEQTGSLLKKRLRDFFSSNKMVDTIPFKDVFRHAAKHGLISAESSERWIRYRENRNDTVHNYGEKFAEQTLKLLAAFIEDAKEVSTILRSGRHD